LHSTAQIDFGERKIRIDQQKHRIAARVADCVAVHDVAGGGDVTAVVHLERAGPIEHEHSVQTVSVAFVKMRDY
jgi:hypothetical protein